MEFTGADTFDNIFVLKLSPIFLIVYLAKPQWNSPTDTFDHVWMGVGGRGELYPVFVMC